MVSVRVLPFVSFEHILLCKSMAGGGGAGGGAGVGGGVSRCPPTWLDFFFTCILAFRHLSVSRISFDPCPLLVFRHPSVDPAAAAVEAAAFRCLLDI